jgi:hypothetical protein
MWKLWHYIFGWHYVAVETCLGSTKIRRIRKTPNGRKYVIVYLDIELFKDDKCELVDTSYRVTPLTF